MKKHFSLMIVAGVFFLLIVAAVIICLIPGNFIERGIIVEVLNSSGDYVATNASQSLYSGLMAALLMIGSAVGFVAIYQFGSLMVAKEKIEEEKAKSKKAQ